MADVVAVSQEGIHEARKIVVETLRDIVASGREAHERKDYAARDRHLDQADAILGSLIELLPTRA